MRTALRAARFAVEIDPAIDRESDRRVERRRMTTAEIAVQLDVGPTT